MNLVALIGSLQKKSLNRSIFETYQQLAKPDFTITEINTADFPHYNQDIASDFSALLTKNANTIMNAEGVLFFSPEYNYSLPGHLKNAIDWLSRHNPQPFNDKKAAIIGASPAKLGTARMQYDLRKIGVYLNLHFMNKPEVMISEAHQKVDNHGKLTDEATLNFIREHIKAFKSFVESR